MSVDGLGAKPMLTGRQRRTSLKTPSRMDSLSNVAHATWSPQDVPWDGVMLTTQTSSGDEPSIPAIDKYYIKGRGVTSAGPGTTASALSSCRVPGCSADLTRDLAYFRKYRICREHLKAPVLIVEGVPSRFCQQCSRFHHVRDFDGPQRTCRAMLERLRNKRNNSKAQREGGGGRSGGRGGKGTGGGATSTHSPQGGSSSQSNSTSKEAEHPQKDQQQPTHRGAAIPTKSSEGADSPAMAAAPKPVAGAASSGNVPSGPMYFHPPLDVPQLSEDCHHQRAHPDSMTRGRLAPDGLAPSSSGVLNSCPSRDSVPERNDQSASDGLQLFLSQRDAPLLPAYQCGSLLGPPAWSSIGCTPTASATAAAAGSNTRTAGAGAGTGQGRGMAVQAALQDLSYSRAGGGFVGGGVGATLGVLDLSAAPPGSRVAGDPELEEQLRGLYREMSITDAALPDSGRKPQQPATAAVLSRRAADVAMLEAGATPSSSPSPALLFPGPSSSRCQQALLQLPPQKFGAAPGSMQQRLRLSGHAGGTAASQLGIKTEVVRPLLLAQQQQQQQEREQLLLQQQQQHLQLQHQELKQQQLQLLQQQEELERQRVQLQLQPQPLLLQQAPHPRALLQQQQQQQMAVSTQLAPLTAAAQASPGALPMCLLQSQASGTATLMTPTVSAAATVDTAMCFSQLKLKMPAGPYQQGLMDGAVCGGNGGGGLYGTVPMYDTAMVQAPVYGRPLGSGGAGVPPAMTTVPESGDGRNDWCVPDDIDAALDALMDEAGFGAVYEAEAPTLERVHFKLHNLQPRDLPPDLLTGMGSWLAGAPAELVQGSIRPGCTQLILDVYVKAASSGGDRRFDAGRGSGDNGGAAAAALEDGSGAEEEEEDAGAGGSGGGGSASGAGVAGKQGLLQQGKLRILGGLAVSDAELARLEAAAAAAGAEAMPTEQVTSLALLRRPPSGSVSPFVAAAAAVSGSSSRGDSGEMEVDAGAPGQLLASFVMHGGNVKTAAAAFMKLLGPRAVAAMSVTVGHEVISLSGRDTGRYVADIRGTMAGLRNPLLLAVAPLAVAAGQPCGLRAVGSHLTGTGRRPQVRCQGRHVPVSLVGPAAGAWPKLRPEGGDGAHLAALLEEKTLPGSHRAEAVGDCTMVDVRLVAPEPGLMALEWEEDRGVDGGVAVSDWLPVLAVPDGHVAAEINQLAGGRERAGRGLRSFLVDFGLVLDYVTRLNQHVLLPVPVLLAALEAEGREAAERREASSNVVAAAAAVPEAAGGAGAAPEAGGSGIMGDAPSPFRSNRSGGGGNDQGAIPAQDTAGGSSEPGASRLLGGNPVIPPNLDSRHELMGQTRLARRHFERVRALMPQLLAFAADSGMPLVLSWLIDFMLEHVTYGDLPAIFKSVEAVNATPVLVAGANDARSGVGSSGGGGGGLPLLHRAVRSGEPRVVDLLLSRAASHGMVCNLAQASGPFLITPLHLAALQPLSTGVLRACQAAGPVVALLWETVTDAAGRTPAMYIRRQVERSLHANAPAGGPHGVGTTGPNSAGSTGAAAGHRSSTSGSTATAHRSWGSDEPIGVAGGRGGNAGDPATTEVYVELASVSTIEPGQPVPRSADTDGAVDGVTARLMPGTGGGEGASRSAVVDATAEEGDAGRCRGEGGGSGGGRRSQTIDSAEDYRERSALRRAGLRLADAAAALQLGGGGTAIVVEPYDARQAPPPPAPPPSPRRRDAAGRTGAAGGGGGNALPPRSAVPGLASNVATTTPLFGRGLTQELERRGEAWQPAPAPAPVLEPASAPVPEPTPGDTRDTSATQDPSIEHPSRVLEEEEGGGRVTSETPVDAGEQINSRSLLQPQLGRSSRGGNSPSRGGGSSGIGSHTEEEEQEPTMTGIYEAGGSSRGLKEAAEGPETTEMELARALEMTRATSLEDGVGSVVPEPGREGTAGLHGTASGSAPGAGPVCGSVLLAPLATEEEEKEATAASASVGAEAVTPQAASSSSPLDPELPDTGMDEELEMAEEEEQRQRPPRKRERWWTFLRGGFLC